ncbi:hypothetical protein LOAG_03112 [Loa loa]|uniref:Torsin-1A n=1 Tax=Loa loa TaxID=7209 RepID=A0A1I7V6H1_LOALO|nr:hypothetical protein LOAG_03112 [Loa loa]EFO25377.2 hypothetical protein LOAG_03112 [Loa loa]
MPSERSRQSYVQNSPVQSSFRNRSRQGNLYPKLEHNYDDSNDSNVSYESDHSEYDDSERSANDSTLILLDRIRNLFSWADPYIIPAFIIIVVVVVFVYHNYSCANSNNGSALLKRYKQQVNSILRKNFTVEYERGTNTKAVLRLIGEKWVYQKAIEPYIILITGTKADMLADALGDVFSNVTGKGEIDRIFCNEYKERQLLESEVTKSLSKCSKSVILHGIDRLRGRAPLYLHSLSDSDHSPFPSALILLTINLFFGSHPSCEDAISNYLLNVWNSDYVGEEQIRPILSRISSFLICLED